MILDWAVLWLTIRVLQEKVAISKLISHFPYPNN